MSFFNNKYDFQTKGDILAFFNAAIAYRNYHKAESKKIARFVFDATYGDTLGSLNTDAIEAIRFEFGALEAPGLPEDGTEPDVYVDKLWNRLQLLVKKQNG